MPIRSCSIDNVAEGVRVLREKADDTNVRLSTMTQELEAMRQADRVDAAPGVRRRHRTRAGRRTDPAPAAPRPARPDRGPRRAGAPLISPQRMFDNAYGDYTGGPVRHRDPRLQDVHQHFPRSDKADDAQLNIGNALYAAGKFREALDALQQVITTTRSPTACRWRTTSWG